MEETKHIHNNDHELNYHMVSNKSSEDMYIFSHIVQQILQGNDVFFKEVRMVLVDKVNLSNL